MNGPALDTLLVRRRATTLRRIEELRASAVATEACVWWASSQPVLRESALATALRERLARIDRALARWSAGVYGSCERCGRDVAVARLEAEPEAECCEDAACEPRAR